MKKKLKKFKKSEIKQWIRENLKYIILPAIFAVVILIMIPVIVIFGVVAVYAKEPMLTSLIEAEATILGFFGLITVYALTSLDSNIDRYEQQIFDLREKHWELDLLIRPETEWEILGEEKIAFFNKRLSKIKEKKRKTVNSTLFTGAFLIGSLLSSILALGIPNDDWSFYLSSFSITFLFASILDIVWTIYDLGKSPEVTKNT